jgi:RimJ/RimL family protein N-acetyltransferase
MDLIEASDDHFRWLLGREDAPNPGLRIPAGGVDEPDTVRALRRMASRVRAVHGAGVWLMVADGEVVGLCGYKWPANADGIVEIGYGVAAERRRRGHASHAVAEMLKRIARDHLVTSVIAETAVNNPASQRVLETNGFAKTGMRTDAVDGQLILWRHQSSAHG